jgi:phosphoglycolate phosphatase
MKHPVVMFDFDGTLVDTFEYLFLIGNMMAKEFGFKGIKRHQMTTFKDKTIRQALRELDVPVFQLPGILLKGMKEMSDRIEDVKMIVGWEAVLHELKEQAVTLGVVSTNTRENIQTVLKRQGLEHIFDFIFVGSGMLGKPRAIKKAIQQYGLDVDRVLYVADEVRDIEASRRVGIAVASVTWGYNSANILQAHKPDYLIDRPHELLQIVEDMKSQWMDDCDAT